MFKTNGAFDSLPHFSLGRSVFEFTRFFDAKAFSFLRLNLYARNEELLNATYSKRKAAFHIYLACSHLKRKRFFDIG